jgi:hypothetical protein
MHAVYRQFIYRRFMHTCMYIYTHSYVYTHICIYVYIYCIYSPLELGELEGQFIIDNEDIDDLHIYIYSYMYINS